MEDTIIWTSYFDNKIFDEYILKETNNVKLFSTSNLSLKEHNINYLNKYYGELCTMYYVWKNNKKSKNVGFQHYRFLMTDINVDNNILVEESHGGQIYEQFLDSGVSEHTIFESLKYLAKYTNNTLSNIIKILIDKNSLVFHGNTFCCSWEIFDDMCNFIFGFLNYLFPNEEWKDPMTLYEYINNCYTLYKNNSKRINKNRDGWAFLNFDTNRRYLIFFIEFLIPLFFNVKYKDILICTEEKRNNKHKSIILDLHNSNDNIDLFTKWHHKNIHTGIKSFKIINYKDTLLYKRFKEEPYFMYFHKWTEFIDDNNINIDNIWNYKISIDEYIDVKSPYDFYNTNSYNILKLT